MSFLSKVELKKQLRDLGIKVEGNCVRKSDINRVLADKIKQVFFEDMPTSLKQLINRSNDFFTLDYKENPAKIVIKDEDITGVVLYSRGDYFSAPKSYFIFQLKGNMLIWDRDLTQQSNYASWKTREVRSQPVLDWVLKLNVYPKPVKYSDYLKNKNFLKPYLE